MFRVARKLSNVKRLVKGWNKTDFSHIFHEKEILSDKLLLGQNSIQHDGYDEINREVELSLLLDLHNIINKEEKFWRQRSRAIRLKDGDQNSKFFHLTTLKHKANNNIDGIMKGQDLLTREEKITTEVVSFFSSLFSWDPHICKED